MRTCTTCHRTMTTQDTLRALDGLCDSCQIGWMLDVPFVLWRCPDHTSTTVTWETTEDGMVATCGQCGRKSDPKKGGGA